MPYAEYVEYTPLAAGVYQAQITGHEEEIGDFGPYVKYEFALLGDDLNRTTSCICSIKCSPKSKHPRQIFGPVLGIRGILGGKGKRNVSFEGEAGCGLSCHEHRLEHQISAPQRWQGTDNYLSALHSYLDLGQFNVHRALFLAAGLVVGVIALPMLLLRRLGRALGLLRPRRRTPGEPAPKTVAGT